MLLGACTLHAADPAESLLEQARQLKKDKKYDEALEFYTAAVKVAPKSVEALIGKAWVHNELRQYGDAISAAEAATRIDAKRGDAWTELGYAQHKMKKLIRAKESLEKAVKLNPNDTTAKTYLAAVLKDLGEDVD
jgi:tetratricopeptide (TPR) repeat protein